jgi:penicillin amidase
MKVIREEIQVRASQPVTADLKYTRHGPVIYEDIENHKAYALRAAWLERGASPYLASLRIDQASNWTEFRDALTFFRAPSENMIWADRQGNIGWQATGITPIRPNWSGLVPVPGDGRYEWDGYLPIKALPHALNPPAGYVATANQNNLPLNYPHSVGYLWSDPFRHARLIEFLNMKRRFTLNDMMQLQLDVLSIPARALVPMLKGLEPNQPRVQNALTLLREWDFAMRKESAAAAIYFIWQRELKSRVFDLCIPENLEDLVSRKSTLRMIEWITSPDQRFGANPVQGRDSLLLESLEAAVEDLERRFGSDLNNWRLGDPRLHHALIHHPLSEAVTESLREQLDIGPTPRPGNGSTIDMTNDNDNQSSGATFRLIADLADWDRSLGSNFPGQSGDPRSQHYRDLVSVWKDGKHFPLPYSRSAVESAVSRRILLQPGKR